MNKKVFILYMLICIYIPLAEAQSSPQAQLTAPTDTAHSSQLIAAPPGAIPAGQSTQGVSSTSVNTPTQPQVVSPPNTTTTAQPNSLTTTASTPGTVASTQSSQVEVVLLEIGKRDPGSMFGSDSYISFAKTGTNIALLIHANTKILSLDQQGTQLVSFTDNLGTDLIGAGKQQKIDWEASHSNVMSFNSSTENGIQFEASKISKDGSSVLLAINSTALPKAGATTLKVKANLSVIPFDNSQQATVADFANVSIGGNDISVSVGSVPISIKLNYTQGTDVFAYTVNTSLAVTKIEAYSSDNAKLLGSMMIVPGQDNVLKINSTAKSPVNLKVYYNAQAKKIVIPVDVSFGVGF